MLELQELEVLHELPGVGAFVHVVAEVADVIHHDDVAVVGQCGLLDVVEDDGLIVLGDHGHGINLGPEEGIRERIAFTGYGIAVAELELFVGHLAVDVEDAVPDGDVGGHLDGEDALSQVRIGKEAADFLFEPEFVVEGIGIGALLGVGHRVVGGLDAEDAYLPGVAFGFQLIGDKAFEVFVHGYFLRSFLIRMEAPLRV